MFKIVHACSTKAMCWKKRTRVNSLCLNLLGSRSGWCAQGVMSKAARPFLTLRRCTYDICTVYLPLVRSFILCTPARTVTTVQMVRTQADGRSIQNSSLVVLHSEILKQKLAVLICATAPHVLHLIFSRSLWYRALGHSLPSHRIGVGA